MMVKVFGGALTPHATSFGDEIVECLILNDVIDIQAAATGGWRILYTNEEGGGETALLPKECVIIRTGEI